MEQLPLLQIDPHILKACLDALSPVGDVEDMQCLLVQQRGDHAHLVSGHQRAVAAQHAGLEAVPCEEDAAMDNPFHEFAELTAQYPQLSALMLLRVLRAADALWHAQDTFPDEPQRWRPFLRELDEELALCPGTGAAHARWEQLAKNLGNHPQE